MNLFFYELKKIFSNRWILLVLIGIIILPSFLVPLFNQHNRSFLAVDDEGKEVPYYKIRKEEDNILDHYKGNLLEDKTFQKIESDYEKLDFLTKVNLPLVEETYGKTFRYEELLEHQSEIASCCLYEEERPIRNPIKNVTYSTLSKLVQLRTLFQKETYQNYFQENYEGQKSKKEIEILQKDLNKKIENTKQIMIGRVENFSSLFSVLGVQSICLSFFFLFIGPSIFNKEEKENTLGLLKTTKEGKRKIAITKISTLIFLAILIPLCSILFSTFILSITKGTFHWNLSAMLLNQTGNYLLYDFFQYYLRFSLLMIVGSLSITSISSLLSSFIRNPYISLGIVMIFFLGIFFFQPETTLFNLKVLAPMIDVNFMIYESPSVFFSKVFPVEELVFLFWGIMAPILFLLSIYLYSNKQVKTNI